MGVDLMVDAIFDMQVKRIHEYKRQLLNIVGIIDRYARIASSSERARRAFAPRVCIIAGKAAPGYDAAKRVIQLACEVARVVNNDVRCAGCSRSSSSPTSTSPSRSSSSPPRTCRSTSAPRGWRAGPET